jgi:replicative DNA helicase|tara:strand:+ start:1000 stop:2391 length:1392 start_codon:yes stop_codon:yes gene_type:complete
MTERVPLSILNNLVHDEEYARQVVPFIEPDYFEEKTDRVVYQQVAEYLTKYDTIPTKEALQIEVGSRTDLTQEEFQLIENLVSSLDLQEKPNSSWLLDTTEKWCKDRAIYLALIKSIQVADGNDDKLSPDAIPGILSDALAVGFDQHVGHDYLDDSEDRFAYYHRVENKIPFDLEYFNKITSGGLSDKTLNIALAGTGVGKSLFMCHVAASVLLQGKNVLYITMEMAEEKIAERIDANLLDVNIQDIQEIPEQVFTKKIAKIAAKTTGHLIVKEYPTASAHSGHFRALMQELKMKKNFKPDIIFVDYLNICASSRYRGATNINSYTYVKAIAEELRGLAVEIGVPIVSATQTTRSGYGSSDPNLTDTSESFGLPATADLMFALVSTEEMEQLNQIMVKQLKNRYNDLSMNKRFVVGIDRAKMRLYDCEQTAQDDLVDDIVEVQYNTKEDNTKSKSKFDDFKWE